MKSQETRQKRIQRADFLRSVAEYMAPGMFVVSLVFLVCQSVLVVILVDMPNFSEHAGNAVDPSSSTSSWMREIASRNGVELAIYDLSVNLIWILWPVVIAEAIFHWVTRPWDKQTRKLHLFSFLFCVCPSLRMCARSHEKGNRLWIPGLRWRYPNRRLRARLERHFSLPMIAIAFLILPVLVVEFFLHDQVEESLILWCLLHVGTGVIWLAFAIEFIMMVSVADKKITYCKEHWLDIAIILLPLISFLRSVQFVRATNALRLPQLTKMLRVYRMRGTAVKALRGLIVLELFSRFFQPNAEQAVNKLEEELREAEGKVRLIRRKLEKARRDLRDADFVQEVEVPTDPDTTPHQMDDGGVALGRDQQEGLGQKDAQGPGENDDRGENDVRDEPMERNGTAERNEPAERTGNSVHGH